MTIYKICPALPLTSLLNDLQLTTWPPLFPSGQHRLKDAVTDSGASRGHTRQTHVRGRAAPHPAAHGEGLLPPLPRVRHLPGPRRGKHPPQVVKRGKMFPPKLRHRGDKTTFPPKTSDITGSQQQNRTEMKWPVLRLVLLPPAVSVDLGH